MKDNRLVKKLDEYQISKDKIYEHYMLKRAGIQKYLNNLSVEQYIILTKLITAGDEKLYLKEIASSMEMNMPELSPIIADLENKGYVLWTHDDSRSGGSYILITDYGFATYVSQEKKLEKDLSDLVSRFGKRRTREFFMMLYEVSELFNSSEEEII